MKEDSYDEFLGSDVTIMACSDCNARCKHCYIGYTGSFEGKELFAFCQQLKQKYAVRLNGTELLLHPEYFKSMELVGQDSLITNGLVLSQNPNLAFELAKIGIKYVGVSYHFGIHEDISGIEMPVIYSAIHALKQAGIIVDIRTTIDNRNFRMLKRMCKVAASWGVNGIKFTNLMNTGNALALENDYLLSDQDIELFFEDIEIQRKLFSKNEFLIRRCGSFGPGKNEKFFCPAGNKEVVITPDLKVYPCFFLARKGMEIGFVEDGRIIMTRKVDNDGSDCLARRVLNNNVPLSNYFQLS